MYKSTLNNIILILSLAILTGCDTPTANQATKSISEPLSINAESNSHSNSNAPVSYKSTGEFQAIWEGCSESHDNFVVITDENCGGDDHDGGCEDEHDDGECQGNRPARNFYLDFNAQQNNGVKGEVYFEGLEEFEGIDFDGKVTWIVEGRESNELFFGGAVTGGTVDRNCFLFSMQDNGEGKNSDADRLQYRLYGQGNNPCHVPGHLPKGYPIAVYQGNIQVHNR